MAAEFTIEHLDPNTLKPHPLNWGIHSDRQKDAVAGSLGKHGWLSAPIVNKRTGFILDGHARVDHARKVGADTVPVRVIDVSEAQELQILATFDRTTELRERDDTALVALLRAVIDETHEVPDGWTPDEVGNLMLALSGAKDGGLELDAPGDDDAAPDDDPPSFEGVDASLLPEAQIRMVQLFFDAEAHAEFTQQITVLEDAFHTDNVTDTVKEAVARAYRDAGFATPGS